MNLGWRNFNDTFFSSFFQLFLNALSLQVGLTYRHIYFTKILCALNDIRLGETNLICWSTGATDRILSKNKKNITKFFFYFMVLLYYFLF